MRVSRLKEAAVAHISGWSWAKGKPTDKLVAT